MPETAKHLWIVNHYAVLPGIPGGTRHFDFARELRHYGWDVTVFASGFRHRTKQTTAFAPQEWWKIETIDGVRFVWIKAPPFANNNWRRILNMLVFSWRVNRLGRRYRRSGFETPEVVMGSSVHLFAVLSAWRMARRVGAPLVMEVRDLWPQTLIDMGRAGPNHPLVIVLGLLERFLYKRAERIVTLLPGASSYMTKHGASEDKIVWISNGTTIPELNEETRAEADAFRVMYIGAHGDANALDLLLETAEVLLHQSQRIHFVLIGDGPEKPRLVEQAQQRGLTNVEFQDPIPKGLVQRALVDADAGIAILRDLPIYKYGISLNKLFDYMAAAKPVVFVGNSFNDPIADAGCGISISQHDPRRIAEAIVRMSEMSPDSLAALGLKGRTHCEEVYAIPVLAKRFHDEVLVPLQDEMRS